MNSKIKTLAILTAVVSSALIAGAQEQARPERTNRKLAEFKCPVCGSPCVSKAALAKARRVRQFRAKQGQQSPAVARQRAKARAQGPQQSRPNGLQRNRQQGTMRFDFDGDGQLSKAERAAMKAYRTELRQERGDQPEGRPAPRQPVDE